MELLGRLYKPPPSTTKALPPALVLDLVSSMEPELSTSPLTVNFACPELRLDINKVAFGFSIINVPTDRIPVMETTIADDPPIIAVSLGRGILRPLSFQFRPSSHLDVPPLPVQVTTPADAEFLKLSVARTAKQAIRFRRRIKFMV
jgi:hypothetical protein